MEILLIDNAYVSSVCDFICEQRRNEYNIRRFSLNMLNNYTERKSSYVIVARQFGEIYGVMFVNLHSGRQAWSMGEVLGTIEWITLRKCENYSEVALRLYEKAKEILIFHNGIRLFINDFSEPAFFHAVGLDYETYRIERYLR